MGLMAHLAFPKYRDIERDAKPHHFCKGCQAPIYDHKPICAVCFNKGLYPLLIQKSKREVRFFQPSKKTKHRRMKTYFPQKKKVSTPESTQQRELALLRKLGANQYYALRRGVSN